MNPPSATKIPNYHPEPAHREDRRDTARVTSWGTRATVAQLTGYRADEPLEGNQSSGDSVLGSSSDEEDGDGDNQRHLGNGDTSARGNIRESGNYAENKLFMSFLSPAPGVHAGLKNTGSFTSPESPNETNGKPAFILPPIKVAHETLPSILSQAEMREIGPGARSSLPASAVFT